MSRSDLHVVLCTDGVFPHALGGMQRHSRLLAEHIARQAGVRLTVLHPHAVPVFDPVLGIEEVPIEAIDEQRLYLRELWRYSGRIAGALDPLAPDVIIAQGFCVWRSIGRFGDRLIVHPHGLEMFQGLTVKDRLMGAPFRALLRYVARRAARVVSLGGKLTPMLEQLVAGSNARVVVLPNAVEVPAALPNDPAAAGPLRILFVGRFAFNKGIDVLIGVARRLAQEGHADRFRFLLAGDGPDREGIEREGIPANVELQGRVDDARLEELYAECHALVLPTRFEGMPTVVLEAMARARPVLVSDVGASAELVSARNGYLLPPGDANALHDALLRFAELTTEQRSGLGLAGRALALERFTWSAVTQRFMAILAELAARSREMPHR